MSDGRHPARGAGQALRRRHGRRRHRPAHPGRRVLHAARPVGLRQDDDAAAGRRLRAARRGRGSCSTTSTCPRTPPHKRRVNTVFQSYALFPHRRVADNIAFGLRYRKLRPRTRRAGASPRRSRSCGWSGMERRAARAALGRPAAARRARPRARARAARCCCSTSRSARSTPACALDLQVELKRIQEQLGVTFIYVTHDQDEALTMSDRVAVMRGGRIEQCGEPRELYEAPATAFVANFLGAVEPDPGRASRATALRLGARRFALRARPPARPTATARWR